MSDLSALRNLTGFLRLVAMTVVTLAFAVPAIAVSAFDRGGPKSSSIIAAWARTILRIAGVRIEIEGGETLPPEAAQLYVASHQSMLDIPALFALVPPRTRFVAKASLFRIPLFGQAISLLGFVPIERADRRAARRALDRAADLARDARPILVFPEGTRSRDGVLLPFKRGAFAIAHELQVPVIPVACLGGARCLPPGGLVVSPGVMRLRVGRILTPAQDDFRSRDTIMTAARAELERLSVDASARRPDARG